jgi:4-alpha-glucanotransferase
MASLVTFTPSTSDEEALRRAAAAHGVEREYWDIFGRKHEASDDVQRAILNSLGVPTGSREQLDMAIEESLWREWSSLAPAALVVSENLQPREIAVPVPQGAANGTLKAELIWEDGARQRFEAGVGQLRNGDEADLRGARFVRKQLPLPERLKLGYHDLHLRLEDRTGAVTSQATARLIVCPDRAYDSPAVKDGKRTAGVFLTLYGLRSDRNWGCGDFTDLYPVIDWIATEVGGTFVGLNPLHIIPNRQPYNTSPYLPTCIYFRNPLYLDIERIEDLHKSSGAMRLLASRPAQDRLAELRRADLVEYEKVWRLKLCFLKLAFREFLRELHGKTERAQAFEKWVEAEGDLLHRFALHQALDEVIHRANRDVWHWPAWPPEFQDPESPAVAAFERQHPRQILFHQYLQWLVDGQLAEAQAYAQRKGLPIGLYHDLALATDRFGADLWAHRGFFATGCRVGAPPDDFSPNGQDWGFPPPNAERHRADGYRLFAETIRRNARHGGALRIDHVMRFFRLYWIPDNLDATRGTYVLDRPSEWLHVLALESVRNKVMVIGEDLGTVEPAFRQTLERFGIRSYRLFYFERDGDRRFLRPEQYPRQALVSTTTHDLPTIAGFWTARDVEARRSAGLIDQQTYLRQIDERRQEKQKMLDVLHDAGLLPPGYSRDAAALAEFSGTLHFAVIGFLTSTPCELLVINQEDILKSLDQQNLPGSTAEYPNWRRKMTFTIEQLRAVPFARDCTRMVADWIRRGGRANGHMPDSGAAVAPVAPRREN